MPDFWRELSVRRDKGKKIQPFSRDKLFLSLHHSLKHRKTAAHDATALTDTIIGKLLPLINDASLDDREIALIASEILDNFDKAAAMSYTAFHPVIIR